MNPVALTEMVDRVFDDRYHVEELVGVGTISAVYAAYDSVESRRVAIKVFDEAVASDETFVVRLLDAVEESATLRHANVVEVLDWGVDGGPFIVSELCEGGSLASLLASGETLTASQALVVTLECARALNYGQEQGFIHHNLSPANVLFSKEQHVRIGDYGLALALADAPVRHAGLALENVWYSSPEQARGRTASEATDLYSLALVINEAVSGTPPEIEDTLVGTLMHRAEAAASLDESLGSLLGPLERCGRVNPSERPEAEELAIALLATAETMERPAPLPLAGLGDAGLAIGSQMLVVGGVAPIADDTADPDSVDSGEHDVPDGDALDRDALDRDALDRDALDGEEHSLDAAASERINLGMPGDAAGAPDLVADGGSDIDLDLDGDEPAVPTLAVVREDSDADVLPAEAANSLDNLEDAAPVFAELADDDSVALDVPDRVVAGRSSAPVYEELLDDADDQLPTWPLAVLGAVAALIVGLLFLVPMLSGSSNAGQVPDLLGVAFDELDGELGDNSWQIRRLEDRVDGVVDGSIVGQSPQPGTELADGEELTVTVSLGSEMVEIPTDLVGLTVEQATSRLVNAGLALGSLPQANSEQYAAGLVMGIDEPTSQMPSGDAVSLRISKGPEDRIVPNSVVGLSIGDATSLLVGLRLQAVEEQAYSEETAAGIVISSIPLPGEIVPADSAVVLVVSAGLEPVAMPDIVGLTLEDAIDEIEALGLIWIDATGSPGEPVIDSLPPIGAIVDVGTEVTIILDESAEDGDAEEASEG